jgi:hypothetical protein
MIGGDETENRRDRFNTCSVCGTLGNGSQNLPTVENHYEQQDRKWEELRPKIRIILQPALKDLKQNMPQANDEKTTTMSWPNTMLFKVMQARSHILSGSVS